jgi:hypothetical protein
MTSGAGDGTTLRVPTSAGSYKLHVVDASGTKIGESSAVVQVK